MKHILYRLSIVIFLGYFPVCSALANEADSFFGIVLDTSSAPADHLNMIIENEGEVVVPQSPDDPKFSGNDDFLVLAGNVKVDGGKGNDTITENSRREGGQLFGGEGNDSITDNSDIGGSYISGGAGEDTIQVNAPYAVLSGGPGADKFAIYRAVWGTVITDFEPHFPNEKIIIHGPTDFRSESALFAQLRFHKKGKDTEVELPNGSGILLKNIAPSALKESNFAFESSGVPGCEAEQNMMPDNVRRALCNELPLIEQHFMLSRAYDLYMSQHPIDAFEVASHYQKWMFPFPRLCEGALRLETCLGSHYRGYFQKLKAKLDDLYKQPFCQAPLKDLLLLQPEPERKRSACYAAAYLEEVTQVSRPYGRCSHYSECPHFFDASTLHEIEHLESTLRAMFGESSCGYSKNFEQAYTISLLNQLPTLPLGSIGYPKTYTELIGSAHNRKIFEDFLLSWAEQGLWQKQLLESYLEAKTRAKVALTRYYMNRFHVTATQARQYATYAVNLLSGKVISVPSWGVEGNPAAAKKIADLAKQGLNDVKISHKERDEALSYAILNNYPLKAIEALISSKTDIHSLLKGESVLMKAVKRPEVVKLLLERGSEPNKANPFGKTPLMYAIQYRNLDSVRLLLDAGADIHVTTYAPNAWCDYSLSASKRTPLMYAAWHGTPSILKLLLEKGADPAAKDSQGYTATSYLLKNEHISAREHYTMLQLLEANSSSSDWEEKFLKIQLSVFPTADSFWRMAERAVIQNDNAMYLQYLAIAVRAGSLPAMQKQAGQKLKEGKYREARALLEQLSKRQPDNVEVMLGLGLTYAEISSYGTNQAYAWFSKAADHGNVAAMYYKGLYPLEGYGTRQDFALGMLWLERAQTMMASYRGNQEITTIALKRLLQERSAHTSLPYCMPLADGENIELLSTYIDVLIRKNLSLIGSGSSR